MRRLPSNQVLNPGHLDEVRGAHTTNTVAYSGVIFLKLTSPGEGRWSVFLVVLNLDVVPSVPEGGFVPPRYHRADVNEDRRESPLHARVH